MKSILNKKKELRGWLPDSEQEEIMIADDLLNYALKKTSFSIYPFCELYDNIHSSDIESLAQSGIERHLPNCCYIANSAIRERQNQEEFIFECWWKDPKGQLWKELHLKDKSTGQFKKITEQLCL